MRPYETIVWMYAVRALLPSLVVIVALWWPTPAQDRRRVALAIAAGWLCDVLFTATVFNPVCAEAASAAGEHFAAVRFDNNMMSVALLTGWVMPGWVMPGWIGPAIVGLAARPTSTTAEKSPRSSDGDARPPRLSDRRAGRPSGTHPRPASPGSAHDARRAPPPAAWS